MADGAESRIGLIRAGKSRKPPTKRLPRIEARVSHVYFACSRDPSGLTRRATGLTCGANAEGDAVRFRPREYHDGRH